MEAAARFLGVRQRSVQETRRRLVRLGFPAPLVDQVVARLIEMRYLDDEEFARRWVESRDRSRPRGENALRRELALKGVARDVVEQVIADRSHGSAGSADADAARELLRRRRPSLEREADPLKRRQKAYALLARSGFDPATCTEVSSEAIPRSLATAPAETA